MAHRRSGDGAASKGGAADTGPKTLGVADVLGMAIQLHKQGMLDAAEELYGRILEAVPEHVDAMAFLGMSRHHRGHHAEGLALLERAVALDPTHVDARNNLGNMLIEAGRLDEAAAAFRTVLAARPQFPGAHANLGVVLKRQNDLPGAEAEFRRALELDPNHGAAWHNLGSILRDTDQHDEALSAFQKALALMPYDGDSYRSVGAMLYMLGRTQECLEIYERWCALEPNNPVARHMLAACSGREAPVRASDAFVRQTFDAFANSFDKVLDKLKYRAPELVTDAVAAALGPPTGTLDVLDAGAGTGLCGPLMRPYARRLVGIDLSSAMLDKAKDRAAYDALETAELTAYLGTHPDAFDLVISADTLCYFGALDAALGAAATALRPGGRLVFTVEKVTDETPAGYQLNLHGRYSHGEGYLRRTLLAAGLTPVELAAAHLRLENRVPVDGFVVTARKIAGQAAS